MNKKEIPQEVLDAAEAEKHLGGTLKRLCKYKGEDVYSYIYDEDVTIGLPIFYLWDGKRARIVYGEQGLKLLGKLKLPI